MPVSIKCPKCGKLSTSSEDVSGRRVKCPKCRESFMASGTVEGAKRDTHVTPRRTAEAEVPLAIGRYRVRAKLGAGAFGTVYRAYDPKLDREVALKVPNPGTLDSPERVERFLREAKAAAGLRHPHIVPVFDAGKVGDHYYIASAFIDGKKLSETIDEAGTDLERAARLTRELAEALAYAHGQGIVHRDIKPDNVMLDEEDRVHLMDFGLASRQDEAKLTKDGSVMGTPSYMAPEQARGQQGEAKPAADQYSAGVVLYDLLTGGMPFEGPPAIVIYNQIHTEPEPPTKRRREIPRDLETICLKAMAKRPEERYPSCQELADDLRRWLEGEPIRARQSSPAERLIRWCRREPLLASAVALAAVCLLATALVASVSAIRLAASAKREAEARQKAEGAREKAEEAQANEARTREKAEEAQRNETAARIKEEQQRKQTEKALDLADLNLYHNRIAFAEREWWLNNLGGAEQLLDACRPDLRQWEWHYLKR